MSPRRRTQRRDVMQTMLDVAAVVLIAGTAVGGVLIGDPLFVALALILGVAARLARRCSRLDAERGDRALDLAQLRRELDACETELAQAYGELARRDTEGGTHE